MASLADVFVAITGDLGPLRQAARDGGQQAGQVAADGFGSKLQAGIKVAAAAAGALMVAGLAGAIARGDATALLAAQVGATGPELARLGKISGALYAEGFGAELKDVNEALRAVIQNGLVGVNAADADIKRVAGNVTNLTVLLGENANNVSAAIQQMLRTGLAKSAEEAFDILVAATQKGVNKSEDLLDTINEYATQFRTLGLDGPAALGLLSQAIQAGARDSDTAADALKEFAIRATDGSALSAEGFRKLGIDASKAAADISAGGPRSAAALDLVLDRLRAMAPGAERTAIAVALFGTKAEDLQDALFAMDLSSASAQLGDVAGAAQRAGATMANTAATDVAMFKREIENGLINAMARAIPVIRDVFGFLSRNREVIIPLASVIGGLAIVIWTVNAAMTAWAAVTAAANALHLVTAARIVYLNLVTGLWLAKMAIIRGATIAWTAVQWFLNAAFLASPIGWIVLGLAALVAAVVLAWKHSETFRAVVMATWHGIQAAASFAWEQILKPLFAIFMAQMRVLGAIAMWLWREVISPAWAGISVAIQIAWTIIQVIWGLIKIYIEVVLAPMFRFLWDIVKLVWQGIWAQIQTAWNLIKIVWDLVVAYVKILVAQFMWLWNQITSIWNGIRDAITAVWEKWIRPLFQAVGNFIENTVVPAFRKGVDSIGKAWDALKELARKPVEFVVRHVINPIVRGYNAIAGKFGGDKVDEIQGFAAGGFFDGQLPGPASDVDNMLARGPGGRPIALAGGEMVINARQTAKNRTILQMINDGVEGFALGGIIDWITNPLKAARAAFGGPLEQLGALSKTEFGRILSSMPRKIFDWLLDKAKSLFSFGGGGGPGGAGPGFPPWPSSPSGQRGDSGVWRSIMALVRASGLPYTFGNAYRHRDPLWHGSGRAVDLMGYNQDALASYFASMQPRVLELIHRTNLRDYGITRGRQRAFPSQWPLHRNHIHIAMSQGGMLPKLMDFGGPLHHGETGINLSGRTEQVVAGRSMDDVVGELRGVRADLARLAEAIGRVLGRELTGAVGISRQLARAR